MADIKIQELVETTNANDNDVIVVDNGVSTNKINKTNFLKTLKTIPNGGSVGQILVKHSLTDGDVTWQDQMRGFEYQVVSVLPTASEETMYIIYLVPNGETGSNIYNEFITVREGTEGSYTYIWEKIGSTDVDLSNYLSKDNTAVYTPTGNYNPATKKYVDDKASIYVGDGVTASATVNADTLEGHSASYFASASYVDNKPTILSGTTEPTSDIGKNGDIYVMYEE